MKTLRLPVALLLAALALPGLGAEKLRMDVRNTFTGPMADTAAMTVLIENDGPDVNGLLTVTGEGSETTYPVELPRGARKKLLTLPGANYGEIRFTLQTGGRDVVRTAMAMSFDNQGGSAVLIGDDSGGLAFLRAQMKEGRQAYTMRDVYVLPEEAPARPVAYRRYSAVVLGPGAERMGDETVEALKDYALGGGTIIVLGGASAPILEDARWAAVLPGRGWRPKTLGASPVLAKLGGKAIPSPFTVLSPDQPAVGAKVSWEGGAALESEVGLGLGRVVVLGYSPLEPPLNVWEGRSKAFVHLLRAAGTNRANALVNSYLGAGGMEGPVATTYGTAGGPGMPPPGSSSWAYESGARSDPFSTTLPPTGTVFGILAAYFVLVVPVSFLVLRKLKRGELAWVTAPLLSLGFAGVLFRSAENLYSASLSSAAQGVVVLQQGVPDAMFYGTSQLFFPRGGVYDLKLRGVDSLQGVQNEYGYGSDALAGFNPVDVGEVIAPRLEANNLAFRELSYSQRMDGADWFRFVRTGDKVRVENLSPYAFNGSLANGAFISPALSLPPGGHADVDLATGDRVPDASGLGPQDPRNFTRDGRMALSGTLAGFRPGPQIGKEVAGRNEVKVLAFAREKTPVEKKG